METWMGFDTQFWWDGMSVCCLSSVWWCKRRKYCGEGEEDHVECLFLGFNKEVHWGALLLIAFWVASIIYDGSKGQINVDGNTNIASGYECVCHWGSHIWIDWRHWLGRRSICSVCMNLFGVYTASAYSWPGALTIMQSRESCCYNSGSSLLLMQKFCIRQLNSQGICTRTPGPRPHTAGTEYSVKYIDVPL